MPANVNEAALELTQVDAGYAPGADVLRGVSLRVDAGQLWAVLGPNGVGKSTLLRLALGLLAPRRGTVRVAGLSLTHVSRRQAAEVVGWVPQATDSALEFSALEVALMGFTARQGLLGVPTRAQRTAASAMLDSLGVGALAARPVGHASGGERRLVFLARALLQAPKLLLLDEPTAFLDLKHQAQVLSIARARVDQGLASVAVLHDLNQAARFATHALLLSQGAVLAAGPCEQVLNEAHLGALYSIEITQRAGFFPR